MSIALLKSTSVLSLMKSVCFITGASRGLGKALSLGFSKALGKDSKLILIARSQSALDEVKREINLFRSDVDVILIATDLTEISNEKAREIISSGCDGNEEINMFDRIILINNVGSIGDISKTVNKLDNLEKTRRYFDLNLHSVTVLNSVFLQLFSSFVEKKNKCILVNISSLAAIQPFQGWSEYCSAKAARDIYFKVTALEFPNVSVINYSPGPVETDMTDEILSQALPEVKDWFIDAKAKKTLVNCDVSVSKLITLLTTNEGSFKSGDHVDFFDK